MPKDGLPTIDDFIQAAHTIFIMQDSLLGMGKLFETEADHLQARATLHLMPAGLAALRFKIILDGIDTAKLIPHKTDPLQFADPPEPEIVQ